MGGQMVDIERRSNAMGEMALIAVLLSLFAGIAVFLNCFGRTDKPDPKVERLISLLRNVRHRLQARRDNSAIGSLLGLGELQLESLRIPCFSIQYFSVHLLTSRKPAAFV